MARRLGGSLASMNGLQYRWKLLRNGVSMMESLSKSNVRWEVVNDTHQYAFAAMAEESDDRRRVGIQVSKNIRNY